MTAGMLTNRDGLPLSCKRPSSISTSDAAAALSGESASRFASDRSLAVTASAAPCTAEPTLDVVQEPPCVGARGNLVSPSSNFTCSGFSPRNSAAIMVITV
jgi:hypothetical protein